MTNKTQRTGGAPPPKPPTKPKKTAQEMADEVNKRLDGD